MQLVYFDDFRLGILDGGQVIDVHSAVADIPHSSPQDLITTVIKQWDTLRGKIQQAAGSGKRQPVAGTKLCPPVPRPGQLVCLAGNYIEPKYPDKGTFNAFLKSPSAVMGQNAVVELPDAPVSHFHFEPELAIVIGKTASKLKASEALNVVFGYTQFIDASARGLPGGFFLGKSWHTFGPMGPAIVTRDEVEEANKLQIDLWINDKLQHSVNSSTMARHIPELLVEVTNVLTLEPGDVVSTGTHHEALTPIMDGDHLKLQVEGLGPALTISVTDAKKRTWDR